jgi:hypothetical protein
MSHESIFLGAARAQNQKPVKDVLHALNAAKIGPHMWLTRGMQNNNVAATAGGGANFP